MSSNFKKQQVIVDRRERPSAPRSANVSKNNHQPGLLLPRGEGRRRGPLPNPMLRNDGGVESPLINAAPDTEAPATRVSTAGCNRPSATNSAQNAANSRFVSRKFRPLAAASAVAISVTPNCPSQNIHTREAVAFNAHRAPVDGLTRTASPFISSQTTSLDRTHLIAIDLISLVICPFKDYLLIIVYFYNRSDCLNRSEFLHF